MHKRRPKGTKGVVEARDVVGEVEGRACVLVDDMIATGGTIVAAAEQLKDNGATEVWATATHGVFSGPAIDRLKNSVIDRVIVTNTLPLPPEKAIDKIEVLSVAADHRRRHRRRVRGHLGVRDLRRARTSRRLQVTWAAVPSALPGRSASPCRPRSRLTASTPHRVGLTRPPVASAARAWCPPSSTGTAPTPQSVSVVRRELRAALTTEAGFNALLDLEVDGEAVLAMVKEMQRDAVRNEVTHVDFIRVSRDEAVVVEVPIYSRARPARSPRAAARSTSSCSTSPCGPSRGTSPRASPST